MFEVTRLKYIASIQFNWHGIPAEFHENLQIDSEVISEGRTDSMVVSEVSVTF
jgi:hypothetical protein